MGTPRTALLAGPVVLFCAALTWVAPGLAQTPSDSETREVTRILASTVCAHCHGPEGRSTDSAVPRLAGQQRLYIQAQIKAFRAQKRRDPEAQHYMWGISSAWLEDDHVVAEIANYFSSQSPESGKPGDPTIVALGKQLYEKTALEGRIANCAVCHGSNAEGKAFFPRLAGQHAQYLVKEMQMQRVGLRDSPPTHSAVRGLNDNEIAAIAAYLQSK